MTTGAALWRARDFADQHVVEQLGSVLRGRAILAHLGQGTSMVATREAIPVDAVEDSTLWRKHDLHQYRKIRPGLFLHLLERAQSPSALAYPAVINRGFWGSRARAPR